MTGLKLKRSRVQAVMLISCENTLLTELQTGCVMPLKRDWAIFYHAGTGRDGRCDQPGKIPYRNIPPQPGIEPRPE